jgi:hypothetical protein
MKIEKIIEKELYVENDFKNTYLEMLFLMNRILKCKND